MTELVGRESETAGLEGLLSGPSTAGGALVLRGEPGIGKSALLRLAEHTARARGFTVLTATGVESEAQLPMAGLHQVLRPLLRHADDLVPTQRDALLTALGLATGTRPEPFLVALAAVNLLTSAATDRPLVISVDDLHWLDPPTQEALTFVAWHAEAGRYVVIGAVRTGHPYAAGAAGLPHLDVTGLDDTAADRLLLAVAGDLREADRLRIRHAARGNPLALLELPAVWRGPDGASASLHPHNLPARLERAFSDRIADMTMPARAALLVAAVDPADDLDEVVAATAVFTGGPTRVDVFDRAVAASLVSVDGMRLAFRHPLIRSAVVQSEAVSRRQAAHAAIAAVVDDAYRRTWHRAQAIVGPDDDLADALEANAAVALARGAVMSAIGDLERSAELTTGSSGRGHRLLLAAQHAFAVGRVDLLDRLVERASRTDLSDLDRGRLEWLREIFNETPGDATRVGELCDIARKAANAADQDLALDLLLGAALRCWWADTGAEARACVVAVTNEVDDGSDDPRLVASLAVAEPVLQAGQVNDRLDSFDPDDVRDAEHLRLLGMAAHAIGDEVRAADILGRAEGLLRDQGSLGLLSQVLSILVQVRTELGEWEGAAAAAAEGQRLAVETGQPIWGTGTMVCTARANALRGDWEGALRLATEAELDASRRRLNDLLAVVQLARGSAWLSAGRPTEAYDALRRLFDGADPSFHQRERFAGLVPYVDAAVQVGRRDDALQVVADLERTAATTPSPLLQVHLRYARAALADDDEADRLFRAARQADLDRWPWIRAQLELAHGTYLRHQRRRDEARKLLVPALATFRRLGARSWVARTRSEMRMASRSTTRGY